MMMVKQLMVLDASRLERFFKALLKVEMERVAFLFGPVEMAEGIMTIVTVMATRIHLGHCR
jgi:hypothetical protein